MSFLRKWFDDPRKFLWMLYGFLVAGAVVTVFAFLVNWSGRGIVPPLIKVIPTEITLDEPVCPEDEVVQEVQLQAARPTVLDIDLAVYDRKTQRIVLGTERSTPTPVPADWNRLPLPIRFIAPKEPPGDYRAVFAITPRGRSSEIAFVDIEFTLVEVCS